MNYKGLGGSFTIPSHSRGEGTVDSLVPLLQGLDYVAWIEETAQARVRWASRIIDSPELPAEA